MAVLPPYSSHALPTSFKELMLNPESDIIDFYPEEFKVDLIGKPFAWLGEVILPFINEKRLKNALERKKPELTTEELNRNRRGTYYIFFNRRYVKIPESRENKIIREIGEIKGEFEQEKLTIAMENEEISKEFPDICVMNYTMPDAPPHTCDLLKGVQMPERYLPRNVK